MKNKQEWYLREEPDLLEMSDNAFKYMFKSCTSLKGCEFPKLLTIKEYESIQARDLNSFYYIIGKNQEQDRIIDV